MRVQVESYDHGTITVTDRLPRAGRLAIELPRGQEIRGRVLTARHRRPVAGAAVVLEPDAWVMRAGHGLWRRVEPRTLRAPDIFGQAKHCFLPRRPKKSATG